MEFACSLHFFPASSKDMHLNRLSGQSKSPIGVKVAGIGSSTPETLMRTKQLRKWMNGFEGSKINCVVSSYCDIGHIIHVAVINRM